jgi:hypothetical protein
LARSDGHQTVLIIQRLFSASYDMHRLKVMPD